MAHGARERNPREYFPLRLVQYRHPGCFPRAWRSLPTTVRTGRSEAILA